MDDIDKLEMEGAQKPKHAEVQAINKRLKTLKAAAAAAASGGVGGQEGSKRRN